MVIYYILNKLLSPAVSAQFMTYEGYMAVNSTAAVWYKRALDLDMNDNGRGTIAGIKFHNRNVFHQ